MTSEEVIAKLLQKTTTAPRTVSPEVEPRKGDTSILPPIKVEEVKSTPLSQGDEIARRIANRL